MIPSTAHIYTLYSLFPVFSLIYEAFKDFTLVELSYFNNFNIPKGPYATYEVFFLVA